MIVYWNRRTTSGRDPINVRFSKSNVVARIAVDVTHVKLQFSILGMYEFSV